MKTGLHFLKRFVFGVELWAATGLTLFLFWFERWLFRVSYLETFALIYDETLDFYLALEKMGILFALLGFLTFLFILASLVSKQKVRWVYFLLFSTLLLVEYGYQNANHNFMALYDLQTAIGAPQNWPHAIPAYFNWWAVVPIALYGVSLFGLPSAQKYGVGLFLTVIAGLIGVYSVIYFYTGLDQLETKLRVYSVGPTLSVQSFFRMGTYSLLEQVFAYHGSRAAVGYQAKSVPENNIIFIIDESIRGDHLSLNGYERPTTPYLEELARQGLLYNWGIASAGSTCTYRSVVLLLTGVSELPDTNFNLKKQPTLFQYARAMNYKTYYFEAQSRTPRFGITAEDFGFVDYWINQEELGDGVDADQRLAAQLATVAQGAIGNFILVFKRGNHFPYNDNYPADATIYTPVLSGEQIVSDNIPAIINSYDNGLTYNLDTFFQTLLANEDILNNTVILYTSDHGETLGAETYPHCGETQPEAVVPLFMIANPGAFDVDVGFRASHFNLFATTLDLMNFPSNERAYHYQPSLLTARAADSVDRYYFHGALFGFDEYKWLPFDLDKTQPTAAQ